VFTLRKIFLIVTAAFGLSCNAPAPDDVSAPEYAPTEEEAQVYDIGFALHDRGYEMMRYDGRRDVSPGGVIKEYSFKVIPLKSRSEADTLKAFVRQNDRAGGRRFIFKK